MAFYPPGAPAGGAAIDQTARDAAAAAQATANTAVNTGAELAALLTTDPAANAALDYRVPVSVKEPRFAGGAVADWYNRGAVITTTGGSPTATLSSAVASLKAGHTMSIDGIAAPLIVQSVSGTSVTFTANAPAGVTNAKMTFGTDNTAAFNSFFAYCLANQAAGFVPSGCYLITGTIGIPEPGDATGLNGLTVMWGGAGINTGRLAYQGKSGGASVMWGGAAGGTMMLFSRVSFVRFTGGLALVGQPSTDPSGVFTPFGPRAGLGFHLSQNGAPTSGTGYGTIDEMVCGEMDLAVQFGTNVSDNNADTGIIRRLVIWRCTNGVLVKHTQGLSYRLEWIHAVSVPGYVAKSEAGGAIDFGSVHLSGCGTASSILADTYLLDLVSSVNGYIFKVGLLRIENSTVRVAALRSRNVHLQIQTFEEANNASTDKNLFLVQGGTLQILGGRFLSIKASGETTFFLDNDGNAKAPRLVLNDIAMPVNDWSKVLTIGGNCVADVSVVAPRDSNQIAFETRHTRLERGRVVLGGPTTDATTVTRLDPMMRLGGTSYPYSYGPRIPKGLCVFTAVIVGDHGANTPSVFKRRYTVYRDAAGACTVVNTETVGADIVQGTDQVAALAITPTTFTINITVQGTAATPVNWRATLVMEAMYAAAADY